MKVEAHSKIRADFKLLEGALNDAFNELKEINAITTESMGYEASNTTEQVVTPDIVMSLDSLASMAMSKTDTLDTLVAAINN